MRILITILLVLTTFVITQAQVPSSFRGTLNIYQSSGTAPNFEIRGIFNDTQGVYTSDSVDVGDKVYIISDGTCTSLTVTSIISTSGGVIRVNVTDDYATLSNAPLGNAAIMEITPNQQFPTFVDGISYDLLSCIQTHFALLVDDLSFTIPPMPQAGNTQDTVVQVSHGLSLLDPVFVNTSGNWIVSNISNDDSLHMAVVTEVISADTLILTYSGITTQTAHGYTVGHVYFVQDDGSYADTVPTNLINDIAFYVVSANKLFITEQRAFTPSTDLNGIYSGSNYVPSGTIAYVDNFQIKDSLDKFIINVNPENDNMSLRGDSITMTFETDNGLVVIDQNTPKTGIRYAASGYVTNDLSLTTKEYVDDAIAGIVVHPEVTVTDGATIDFTISPLQVLTGEVISNSITASHIATGAVGSDEIATSAVTTNEILDGTILTTDLAFTPLTGSGTANNLSKFTGSFTLGNSILTDDGTTLDYTTSNSSDLLLRLWNTGTGTSKMRFVGGDNKAAKYQWTHTSGWTGAIEVSNNTTNENNAYMRFAVRGASGTNTEAGLTASTKMTILGSGNIGVGNTSPSYIFDISSTGGMRIPVGTTLERPSGAAGVFRYNTDSGYEGHNGSSWVALLSGSGTTNYIPKWSSGTALGNSSVQDDGVRVSFASPFRMQNWTTAARPASPLSGDVGWNTTNNNADIYNGSAWVNYAQHSSGTGLGTATQVAFNDANGRLAGSSSLLWNYTSNFLQIGTTAGNAGSQLNVAGNTSILGTLTLGYSAHAGAGTSRIRATRNSGSNPIIIACGAGAYFKIKGTSTESIQSAPSNYLYYPAIAGVGTAGSAIEIEALSSSATAISGGLFISGTNPNANTQGFGCIGLGIQNSTPNSSYVQSLYGVFGRGQYILSTANAADTDMGSSSLYLYGVYGDTRNNSNFTNGAVYGYGGYFVGDGTSYASPTGAIMNESYGIFVKGYGATQSWAVFSDEGTNWFEDEVRVGGTASTPTANVDIDGSLRLRAISTPASVEDGEIWTSSTQKAILANQAGVNQALVGVIFTGTANATTNNTNTDVSITPTGVGTLTLPANFFATGKQIKVTLSGNYTTDAVATPTLQLKLKAGSTTIATFSANTIPTKTSNGIFTAEFVITCRTTGASGTVMGFGEMELNDTELTRDASWKTPATATVTLDTTAAQALAVTAAFGTADTDNSITVNQFSIEILN